ncbi:MAG: hypothetical protein J6W96_04985 [Alphaproteobacteria bacterium]|nr:hypothetical protein [Alphaproteobacteria bacterium]
MKKIEEYAEQAEESFNNHVDNIPDGDIPLLPDETSIKVAEFNEKQATDILKEAHITPENPNYKKYLGLTEANVHTWRRFSTYDNTVREMLIETLSNPEMTIEQYQEATKRFRVDQIELQQLNASGSTFNGTVDESYPALMLNEDAAVQEGIKIRKRLGTTYPSVFYEEGSSLPNRRVIAVIEDESAYGIVDAYAAKHSTNGLKLVVEVDNEGKEFVKITDAQGRVQSPGSFFNGRINEIDNFLGKSELDFTDEELFNCLEKGDYDGFMELRKTRGKNRNKTNLAMRNLLNQRKDLFNEVCEVYRKAGGDPEKFMQGIQKLKERYAHNVEVIAAETNYGALAKPKGKIDRVMFSVRPADLAQQSTFQNWKSCMNAAGLNHRYVKETIGRGSIIAYGYSSENPAQMVSRILINPYENEKGEIIYRANRAMYGQPNSAFRKTVEQLVEQEFNNPEAQGIFRRNPYLYPDGDPGCIFKIRNKGVLTIKRGEVFDFEGVKYPKDWRLTIEGDCTIKNLKEMPKTLTCAKGSNIFFENCVNLTNIDLSQCESVTIRENCNLKGTKLPKYVVFENVDISGLDLSQCEHVTISGGCNLKGTKLPKYVVFDNVDISGLDLSQCEHVTISGDCN